MRQHLLPPLRVYTLIECLAQRQQALMKGMAARPLYACYDNYHRQYGGISLSPLLDIILNYNLKLPNLTYQRHFYMLPYITYQT